MEECLDNYMDVESDKINNSVNKMKGYIYKYINVESDKINNSVNIKFYDEPYVTAHMVDDRFKEIVIIKNDGIRILYEFLMYAYMFNDRSMSCFNIINNPFDSYFCYLGKTIYLTNKSFLTLNSTISKSNVVKDVIEIEFKYNITKDDDITVVHIFSAKLTKEDILNMLKIVLCNVEGITTIPHTNNDNCNTSVTFTDILEELPIGIDKNIYKQYIELCVLLHGVDDKDEIQHSLCDEYISKIYDLIDKLKQCGLNDFDVVIVKLKIYIRTLKDILHNLK